MAPRDAIDDAWSAPPEGVRVYVPVDPELLAANAERLAAELFGMRDLADGGRTFEVHPASGYLSYADLNELGNNPRGEGLPRGLDTVERIARGFLTSADRTIVGSRVLRQEGVPALFPGDIRPIWIGQVVPDASRVPDHVLCQFGAYLQVDRARTARVEGAAIDVRIGRAGKIIGLTSRWRPLVGDILSDAIEGHDGSSQTADPPMTIRPPIAPTIAPILPPTAPPLPPSTITSASEDEDDDVPELVYWLAGENAPQTFVAPMWMRRSGHHGGIEPASSHSLVARIWQRVSEDQIDVQAKVRGGSGDFEYRWGEWSSDTIFDAGVADLGSARAVLLDRGLHNVMLLVLDRQTGVVTQIERTIFPDIDDVTVADVR